MSRSDLRRRVEAVEAVLRPEPPRSCVVMVEPHSNLKTYPLRIREALREKIEAGEATEDTSVLVVPRRCSSMEEWQRRFAPLRKRADREESP